ncbi:MAG: hypothetical protein Q9174_006739, partial [Haloplaca sp. 1 TL-2023]
MKLFFAACLQACCIVLTALSASASSTVKTQCTVCAPNPIASIYPNNITGTFNATTSIIVVPIDYARSLLPTDLAPLILTHAYKRFSIPSTHYPLVVENAIEHDIRIPGGISLPDFSSFRLTFPFINNIGDGFSCFRYISHIYLSELVPFAIQGYETYGAKVIKASFDPSDAAYRKARRHKALTFDAYPGNATAPFHIPPTAFVTSRDSPKGHNFPLAFYKNVTNQPFFGDNRTFCDDQKRFWNTSLSEGENEPRDVRSVVKL